MKEECWIKYTVIFLPEQRVCLELFKAFCILLTGSQCIHQLWSSLSGCESVPVINSVLFPFLLSGFQSVVEMNGNHHWKITTCGSIILS